MTAPPQPAPVSRAPCARRASPPRPREVTSARMRGGAGSRLELPRWPESGWRPRASPARARAHRDRGPLRTRLRQLLAGLVSSRSGGLLSSPTNRARRLYHAAPRPTSWSRRRGAPVRTARGSRGPVGAVRSLCYSGGGKGRGKAKIGCRSDHQSVSASYGRERRLLPCGLRAGAARASLLIAESAITLNGLGGETSEGDGACLRYPCGPSRGFIS